MNPRQLSFTAALVFLLGVFTLFGADTNDFKTGEVDGIWKELWKAGVPKTKEPKVQKLSERQVAERMVGNWTVMFGVIPDRLVISLATNRLVTVSGQKDGAAWKKTGQWRVISDKLVLFLKEEELPEFIFLTGRKPCIFDPWARTMMSELKREK